MGYSCAAKASMVHSALLKELKKTDPTDQTQNVWISPVDRAKFMEERGRENADGAITGTVFRFMLDGQHIRKAGSYRIEPDGKITRFPGTQAKQREAAEAAGKAEYERVYGRIPSDLLVGTNT